MVPTILNIALILYIVVVYPRLFISRLAAHKLYGYIDIYGAHTVMGNLWQILPGPFRLVFDPRLYLIWTERQWVTYCLKNFDLAKLNAESRWLIDHADWIEENDIGGRL